MAGLVSPKPVSYLQHNQYNPYSRGGGLSNYSVTPPLSSSSLAHVGPHQSIGQFMTGITGNAVNANLAAQEDTKIYGLVVDLMDPNSREGALLELSKKREQYDDLALVLWHSFGIMPALLQEIVSVYPQLSPPNLTAHISNRVCNALALLQCVASHPETRQLFLNAHIPLFLYPFLNTTSKTRPFEYLRLTSLGVIGALVKQNDNNTVIHFLLSTEIIPLCLRIMETGSELSKTVAIFIVQKILLDETGLTYICHTYERFYAVGTVLSNMVNQLVETQAVRLLKHVVRCYLRLSDNLRAREALRACLPEPLRDHTFMPFYYSFSPSLITGIRDSHLALASPIIAYWGLSLFFHFLDISGWKWLEKYRIHESVEVQSRNRATRTEVVWAVILQHAIQTVLGLFWLSAEGEPVDHQNIQAVGPDLVYYVYWWAIPTLQFFAAMFIIDTWQYFLHRLMHVNKFLYKQFHSVHHRLYVPYAFGSLYNHPFEGFLLDSLGAVLAESLTQMSTRQAMLLFTFSTLKTVDDHCGYSLPFDPLQIMTGNNADYHDIHHQVIGIKANFSQPFFVHWDSILGTRMTRRDIELRRQKQAQKSD
ncbi:hypothetical protein H0H87_003072 [Tephrocybe sp. NHM501043]|nr:hypothetical protein H0H87_003072 [Tephrocybe sp. NHM501043]